MEKKLEDLLAHCIRCGFCLEACPTFQLTGNELESPRGRIYLIRAANDGDLNWKEDVKSHLDLCLGCRACETACPSGVEYGSILEMARDRVEELAPDRPKRLLLESTTHPGVLKTQLTLSHLLPSKRLPDFLSQLLAGAPAEADLPQVQPATRLPELDESQLPPVKGKVYFLEGCAMKVLFDRVNQCSRRLLRRAGYEIEPVAQGCCGALHAHNGYLDQAEKLGIKLASAMDQSLPVIVNSAGCGSTMKDLAKTLPNNPTAREFSGRVFDISEFLFNEGFVSELDRSPGINRKVAYHEACHLVHGQRISSAPKSLLESVPQIEIAGLEEADMCCGSAGIYNVTQPAMARALLNRKWEKIAASKAEILVSGNPGCHSWIAQAAREQGGRIQILHTAELLEASFIGLEALLGS